LLTLKPNRIQHCVQNLTSWTDKWLTQTILFGAGGFTNYHQLCSSIADTNDRLGPSKV
jgi:hypothetical protein